MFIVQRRKNNYWFDCENMNEFLSGAIKYKEAKEKEYPGIKFRIVDKYEAMKIVTDTEIAMIKISEDKNK